MRMDTKLCKITGKELDMEVQKRTGNGLIISTAVRFLYKRCNKDIQKTRELLKDYYWIEETRAYYPDWRSCSRALTMAGILDEKRSEDIYNREFLLKSKCQLETCDKNVSYEMREKASCCITHYNQSYAIKTNKFDISDYNHECLECGMKFANNIGLGVHISQKHFTAEEYYIKFHKKSEEEGFCKWCKTATAFNNFNDGYNNFCYNTSCNVNYYNKFENRHECGESISKSQIESQNMPNQIGYWTKKGYSEEQAKALISERQTTNSVEAIMKREKCDIDTATGKRKEITKKWLESFPKQNYSNVSQELFWKIHDLIKDDYKEIHFATILNGTKTSDGINNEYRIETDTSIRSLDFYIKDVNKVIEFNGSYWHSSVSRDVNYSVERDIKRNEEVIRTLNCRLLVVNELDYYKDKNKVVEECIQFIKNGN
jgi:hypothetical protein